MIWLFVVLITGCVWLFCTALYLVSESTVPEGNHDYCRRMNTAAIIEWVSQAVMAFVFISGGYVWFGVICFPFAVFHCVRYVLRGPPPPAACLPLLASPLLFAHPLWRFTLLALPVTARRLLQNGPAFTVLELHKQKFRKFVTRYYTAKLVFYAVMFLTIAFKCVRPLARIASSCPALRCAVLPAGCVYMLWAHLRTD